MRRESERLNERIISVVGLDEESQRRMTLLEEIVYGHQRELGSL